MTAPAGARDPLRMFRGEARELVDALARELAEPGIDASRERRERVLRGAHSLKGAAHIVGQRAITDAARELEAVLAPLRAVPPQAIASAEAVAIVERMSALVAALPPPPASPTPTPTPSTRGRQTLLVVDDSQTWRSLERNLLESAGYAVEVASSGEDGLTALAQRSFALALVDVEMPGMDGPAFVRAVRASAHAALPVILVTGHDDAPECAPGAHYICKTQLDRDALLALIARLVAP